MSVPWARVRAMRLLHTSDWHLGRSLHRADLRAAQSAFLDHLVEVARAEKVDAVLVAGDVYDRAVPPVDAVELCEDAHGPVAVYGVPYLEPDAVRAELPGIADGRDEVPRGHAGVLGHAVAC